MAADGYAKPLKLILKEATKTICQISHPPSLIPIPCSRKRLQTSSVSIPPICSLITRSASICSRLSRAVSKSFASTLNSSTSPRHSAILALKKMLSSLDGRFEVDGANAVRQFLTAHNVPEEQVQTAWEAIALHTTPGITQYMRPEIALLYSGVGLDVLGKGFDQFPSELRDEIVARSPRTHFKERFIQEYFAGFAHKPGTTHGTVNSSICERLIPGYKAPNACDLIAASPFPDSA